MIDANYILKTELLDLLFDGRNKNYGAYELRKNYQKRMFLAVTIMLLVCLLLFLLFSYAAKPHKQRHEIAIADPTLVDLKKTERRPEVIPPPPPKPKVPEVKVRQFTAPIITDKEVTPDEKPPEMTDLDNAKIGKVNVDGTDDIGIAPPIDTKNTGVIDIPKKPNDEGDGIVMFVQIQSEYPGGLSAWQRYLNRELPRLYTDDLTQFQGRVVVQFIVDKEGNVSDAHGIEGPKELWEIAERTIMKSGKWKPAIQNGRPVKSYKSQPIIFKSEDNN